MLCDSCRGGGAGARGAGRELRRLTGTVGCGKGDVCWLGLVFCAAAAKQDGVVTYCCSLFGPFTLHVFVECKSRLETRSGHCATRAALHSWSVCAAPFAPNWDASIVSAIRNRGNVECIRQGLSEHGWSFARMGLIRQRGGVSNVSQQTPTSDGLGRRATPKSPLCGLTLGSRVTAARPSRSSGYRRSVVAVPHATRRLLSSVACLCIGRSPPCDIHCAHLLFTVSFYPPVCLCPGMCNGAPLGEPVQPGRPHPRPVMGGHIRGAGTAVAVAC